MNIRNKFDTLYLLERLGLNYFPKETFNPKEQNYIEKVKHFVNENGDCSYVIQDVNECNGKTYFNISKEDVLRCVGNYTSNFSVAVSSENYGDHILIGDIYISKDLRNFWILASDNPNYNTHDVQRDPKWNLATDYFDKRIKFIGGVDKIIDYIFVNNLFNTVVEFAVYPERVGKTHEFVVIFELRTNY